jgi:predicted SAM-dependent methyltransferase
LRYVTCDPTPKNPAEWHTVTIERLRRQLKHLRQNIDYLLTQHGRLAFWGLGNYFLQNVPSSLSDQPGIFLVDKRHRYSFGQKQGQLPKILEKEKVELIIISAVTNSDPYRAISRDIGAGYPDALVIPLEHLLVSKFRKFWNQVAKCCTKLHLACGTVYKEGWLNIDNNSGRNLKSLDLCCDLSKGIPAQDNSVDFIYHEHFLEHLTPDEARVFLNECMRVLKHGGVMRLSMPDLDMVVRTYLNPEIFEKEHAFRESIGMGDFTPAAVINAGFRRWNHKYLYDRDELVIRLGEVGVAPTQIQFVNSGESVHPDLRNLETRHYSDFLIAEITKN